MQTLLDFLGWDSGDLDKSGGFCTIEVMGPLKNICFKSHPTADRSKHKLVSDVIEVGDKIKFSKAIKYQKMEAKFSFNPMTWLVWIVEFIYSKFNGNYKRLNIMELSMEGFNNPSFDINDFPFDEPLNVDMVISSYDDMRSKIVGRTLISLLHGEERWFLSFDVFSNVTLIEIDKANIN
ncbi:hypothetical protein OW491_16735 [Neptunomonas sp. CHC150]|uniref:hypothetical protein n=1 Tax=Neptunomonas sp. CHC150 TaxID=2998324 RepID=UPI0025B04049|nr:hypothetical protein [Neptunomonas sp. CHC150]MDN2661460.1 hypothetical protein [Neptunomonas sp. CHC150]